MSDEKRESTSPESKRTWAELLDDAEDGPEFARVLQALMAAWAAKPEI